jgi:wyosine [tRNA(Phe)-imidazoG37] synthetase (radical SAM superfamily)
MTIHHIFGPVASRRLGRSLGIDLIPFKTCTYNCAYCECGRTTDLRTRREDFFSPAEIIDELVNILEKKPELDYITLAGSGEPTLSLSVGKVIGFLKDTYPQYRVTVLTNGSLLNLAEVRNALIRADLVIPTLTSAFQETCQRIHRPHPSLTVSSLIEGIISFRKIFPGEIWLEVFLVPPFNTTEDELYSLKKAIRGIGPERIQLNMLDRPGTESWVYPPVPSEMNRIREYFSEIGIPVDIIETDQSLPPTPYDESSLTLIQETLLRRPCTAEDIAQMTGLHTNEVMKRIATLLKDGVIQTRTGDRGTFYLIQGEGQSSS